MTTNCYKVNVEFDPSRVGFENKFLNKSDQEVELMLLEDQDYDHGVQYR